MAVQAASEITWGPLALDMLESSLGAQEVIDRLIGLGPELGTQFAVVDSGGAVAAFTSSTATPQAGHATGDYVSCQANLMEHDTVWGSMLGAYNRTAGALEDRLLASLQAAESEGGDARGRQSASLLVVSGVAGELRTGNADDPVTDIRVDDHRDPVAELARLLAVKRAHDRLMGLADIEDADARATEALAAVSEAPGDPLCQWAAIRNLAAVGQAVEAAQILRAATTRDHRTPRRLATFAASLAPTEAARVQAVLDLA